MRSNHTHLNAKLRTAFQLREAITVDVNHEEDDPLQQQHSNHIGEYLALAAAGYFHETLMHEGGNAKELQIGIAWGFVVSKIADYLEERHSREVEKLNKIGHHENPRKRTARNFWFPLIGNFGLALEASQAGEICHRLCEIYDGIVEPLGIGTIENPPCKGPSPAEQKYFCKLAEKGDVILTSASHWHEHHLLFRIGRCSPNKLPPVGPQVAGLLAGVFLAPDGSQVPAALEHYRIASLGYEGFQQVASRGRVILVAGGKLHRPVILAALRGKLASVLITTTETGVWLLNRQATELS